MHNTQKNEHERITSKFVRCSKTVLRGNLKALSSYTRIEIRYKISHLNYCLKKQENEDQCKPKTWKEIKIRTQTNGIETWIKPKASSLEVTVELINLYPG